MRVLVLGGSQFLGRAIVEAALANGGEATSFHRGVHSDDVPGAEIVYGDRTSNSDLARLGDIGPWDAVIDTSGFDPANVQASAKALLPSAGWYVFVSSVSVYRDWPKLPLSETSQVLQDPPSEDVEDGPTRYGAAKAAAEVAVRERFGDRSTVLRPGVILGPREYVGRLPWWLRRVAAGGDMVAPSDPGRRIQPIDVRDAAEFALLCASRGISGTYNIAGPGTETFGDMLNACAKATASVPNIVWVPDDQLLQLGIRQWSELPLWRTYPGVWKVDASKAEAAGLECRLLDETVSDTWHWLHTTHSEYNERVAEIGLSAEREIEVLANVRQ